LNLIVPFYLIYFGPRRRITCTIVYYGTLVYGGKNSNLVYIPEKTGLKISVVK